MHSLNNKKVGVFLVGSRKSATTSVANFLNSHKDISLSSNKEPNYFNKNHNQSIDAYHSLFDWNSKIQLEASTSYTTDKENTINICNEIQAYNPSAKIIYIVRDPLDRIQSHYRMSYERGDLNTTLNKALQTHKLLLDCSRYFSQIINYIGAFGRENILILKNEDLNGPLTAKVLIDFLSLDVGFQKNIGNDNSADIDYRMPRAIDRVLNNRLYALLKLFIPKPLVSFFKLKYYHIRNNKMSVDLNYESIELIKKELTPEMTKLQKIVSFDISPWIDKLNSL